MKQVDKEILKKRAKELAQDHTVQNYKTGSGQNMIKFLLTPEVYGIESKYVREVTSLKELTRVPNTPDFVTGVINLRGQIISIIDLKKFFNLKQSGLTEFNKILVLSSPTLLFGIIADKILENAFISLKELDVPPPTISGIGAEFILGIARDGTIVLDGSTLLGTRTIIVDQQEKNKQL